MIKKGARIYGLVLTIVTFIIVYFPIFMIFLYSVNESKTTVFTNFSFKWYAALLNDNDGLLKAIENTIIVALLSTVISTILGTFIAIGINSLERKKRVKMMLLNNIPVINPDIVTAVSISLVLMLLPISLGIQTVLIAHIFFSIPYVVLNIMPKLRKLDPNIYEAALDLGCTRFKAIEKVIIPAIKTGIISGALMAFTMSIDDFVISYFTAGQEFVNVSMWVYSHTKKTPSPSVYAYNTLIIIIALAVLLYINFKKPKNKEEKA